MQRGHKGGGTNDFFSVPAGLHERDPALAQALRSAGPFMREPEETNRCQKRIDFRFL